MSTDGTSAAAGGPAPPAIEARALSLLFEQGGSRIVALDNVDLSIAKGEFVSLIGPSGCGKTSLLRMIADLAQPTSGMLRVAGRSAEEARKSRSYGIVFQQPALLPWRRAEGNVALPLEIMGRPRADRAARTRETLARVDLAGFEASYPWQLSGGMQQRVAIARAMSFGAELLLMDEPFGALDEITRDALNLYLRAIWEETQATVVFVTHSIAEAVFLSDRIVVMSPRPGRIVETIDCALPRHRTLDLREQPEFLECARKVRSALSRYHSYD